MLSAAFIERRYSLQQLQLTALAAILAGYSQPHAV